MAKKGLYRTFRIRIKTMALALLCAGSLGTAGIAAGGIGKDEGVEIPVVMYHMVLKDESRHGKYVISPEEFENDLTYLKKHGYTTILISDLIAYTRGGELPEKPVLLTFDDGYYNNYVYAFETARQFRCRFVIAPVASWSDRYTETGENNAAYSHIHWDQLKEMADSGLVEVQNHSYALHEAGLGVKRLAGESPEQYRTRLSADLTMAQERIEERVGMRPTAFVYPYGAMSEATPELVKELGFACTLTCEEKISRVTRDPASLYGLGRFLRPSGGTSADFFLRRMGLE